MGEMTAGLRAELDRAVARRDLTQKEVEDVTQELQQAVSELGAVTAAAALVQEVAQTVQTQAHAAVASVVTRCLEAVYGPDAYEFRVVFEKKRGRTEARLAFVDPGAEGGGEELDPTCDTEGGQLDVASFALRLAALILTQPPPRRFLALDEPFRFVDAQRTPLVRDLLLSLAEELDFQFLLITHNRGLCGGAVIELDR